MSRQHGLEKLARNMAVFGAAYWAADRAQASGLVTVSASVSAKSKDCMPASGVRHSLMLLREIFHKARLSCMLLFLALS